jgi:hypothetical protein
MARYIVTSGGVRFGEVEAVSDKDFQQQNEKGFQFWTPILIQVWTDNPFSSYGKISEIPPAPLFKMAK